MGRHYEQCGTPLHIFERGNVILEWHCREIILDHVRLFRGAISPDFLFLEDKVSPLVEAEASNALESEDLNCMQWFA